MPVAGLVALRLHLARQWLIDIERGRERSGNSGPLPANFPMLVEVSFCDPHNVDEDLCRFPGTSKEGDSLLGKELRPDFTTLSIFRRSRPTTTKPQVVARLALGNCRYLVSLSLR